VNSYFIHYQLFVSCFLLNWSSSFRFVSVTPAVCSWLFSAFQQFVPSCVIYPSGLFLALLCTSAVCSELFRSILKFILSSSANSIVCSFLFFSRHQFVPSCLVHLSGLLRARSFTPTVCSWRLNSLLQLFPCYSLHAVLLF
jgi:hypothetical protein